MQGFERNAKIAVIGASYLQKPLIDKAKEMGLETHVFAWAANDVGEKAADFFYPISIKEKEKILDECRRIGINGVCSIGSDLAAITVDYVASEMGLTGNTVECSMISTNKYLMREQFYAAGVPSPESRLVKGDELVKPEGFSFPVIVKPTDRSGSRGVTKVMKAAELDVAIAAAREQGFEKSVLIEEYVDGPEYSVEYMSWKGKHNYIAVTKKYTTGAPNFIETAHLEPSMLPQEKISEIKDVITHALDSLKIEYGASHSEVKITPGGEIKVIEIGSRMGGDLIGSDLVKLSTGIDFVKETIKVAMGIEPECNKLFDKASAVRYILSAKDMLAINGLSTEHPEYILGRNVRSITNEAVNDSSQRFGYVLMQADKPAELIPYLEYSI